VATLLTLLFLPAAYAAWFGIGEGDSVDAVKTSTRDVVPSG